MEITEKKVNEGTATSFISVPMQSAGGYQNIGFGDGRKPRMHADKRRKGCLESPAFIRVYPRFHLVVASRGWPYAPRFVAQFLGVLAEA